MINGEYTQVFLSAREIDETKISPVSYTHLDVYKRQVHNCVVGIVCCVQHWGCRALAERAVWQADRVKELDTVLVN